MRSDHWVFTVIQAQPKAKVLFVLSRLLAKSNKVPVSLCNSGHLLFSLGRRSPLTGSNLTSLAAFCIILWNPEWEKRQQEILSHRHTQTHAHTHAASHQVCWLMELVALVADCCRDALADTNQLWSFRMTSGENMADMSHKGADVHACVKEEITQYLCSCRAEFLPVVWP